MRSWAREPIGRMCGRCGNAIAAGDPVLLLAIAGVQTVFVRCAGCQKAFDGDEPPADLPLLPQHRAEPMAPQPAPSFFGFSAKTLAPALPFDWRARAAATAEREPGEDG